MIFNQNLMGNSKKEKEIQKEVTSPHHFKALAMNFAILMQAVAVLGGGRVGNCPGPRAFSPKEGPRAFIPQFSLCKFSLMTKLRNVHRYIIYVSNI